MKEEYNQDEYFDYKGLCKFLKIKYSTARVWKCRGKLPFTKFNGKVLFPKKAIMRELNKNYVRSVSAAVEEATEGVA